MPPTPETEKANIASICIDPKWRWALVNLADGQRLGICLTLVHPQYGEIVSLLPKGVAAGMGEALTALSKQ